MEKKSYSINELTRQLAITSKVIRTWEKEFSIKPTLSLTNGRRFYTSKQVQQFKKIKEMLYEKGLSITQAKESISNFSLGISKKSETAAYTYPTHLKEQLNKLKIQLLKLKELL